MSIRAASIAGNAENVSGLAGMAGMDVGMTGET